MPKQKSLFNGIMSKFPRHAFASPGRVVTPKLALSEILIASNLYTRKSRSIDPDKIMSITKIKNRSCQNTFSKIASECRDHILNPD